jgi:ADP-heptose:LPS heptosyltransferase
MRSLPQRAGWRISSWLTAPALSHAIGEPLFRVAGRRKRLDPVTLSDYHRLLVVRTDEIGDIVLCSAFLRELRANLPDAWITLVVKKPLVDLVAACPYVNEVLPYDWQVSPYWGPIQLLVRALRLARTRLWRNRFDIALLPRWNTDYYGASQLLYVSGAGRRVAYSAMVTARKADANRGYDRLFTDLLTDREPRHEVERNLQMIRVLGGTVRDDRLEVWTRPQDDATVTELLRAEGITPGERLVALGVSARHAKKVWPADNFLELGRWLHEKIGARLLVVGSQEDARAGQVLELALGRTVINLAGRTTLRELAALMRRVNLFVGNDSGPKHIAAAAGAPVVEISWHPHSGSASDPFSPVSFAPWKGRSIVLQPDRALAPCVGTCDSEASHCISLVTPDSVKAAALSLLELTLDASTPRPS